ncbi:lactoylglutathione lyase-like lyase [Burkholderiales bacterium JOSHI_001]|nr:lactoylglutathione lyase-like lyase [Burkholderiales bacterium JOSHI_001]
MSILGLHHSAYRCRDSEQTRAFYEGFLGLPLVNTLEIHVTKTGRTTDTLHTFFAMADGSCLAFFEAPDMPFDFKPQHDYDLHIALAVDRDTLEALRDKGRSLGMETRGIVDHGLFDSLYFRDPNGYVIELACPREGQDEAMDPSRNQARAKLDRWTAARRSPAGS